jgi:hypothetical protein
MERSSFPVQDERMASEILLRFVWNDVQAYLALANSGPLTRALLIPHAAHFVARFFPDALMLLAVASDAELLQEIDAVNNALVDKLERDFAREKEYNKWAENPLLSYKTQLIGVDPLSHCHLRECAEPFSQRVKKAMRKKNVLDLSDMLRHGRSRTWREYVKEFAKGAEGEWKESTFRFGDTNRFYWSDLEATKLALQLLRIGIPLGLRWRLFAIDSPITFDFAWWPRDDTQQHILAFYRRYATGDKESDIQIVGDFATDLVSFLNGKEPLIGETVYQFYGEEVDEIRAAECATQIMQLIDAYNARSDAIYSSSDNDLLLIDTLKWRDVEERVCEAIDVEDCSEYWFDLLGRVWLATLTANRNKRHARNCCSCMREAATMVDSHFALPFCDSTACVRNAFESLARCGLWNKSYY